jgi:hypothetical protein
LSEELDSDSQLPNELPNTPLLMGLSSQDISLLGLVVSSNNRRKIIVSSVQEHLIMTDYPATMDSEQGILHFIHSSNPIPGTISNSDSMNEIFTQEMSRVSISFVYALHISLILLLDSV